MKRRTMIPAIVLVVFLALLAWAPWLDNAEIHDNVFAERAHIDGSIDRQTGDLICDYKVGWFPFGRYAASCEAGYFVTFWGQMLL